MEKIFKKLKLYHFILILSLYIFPNILLATDNEVEDKVGKVHKTPTTSMIQQQKKNKEKGATIEGIKTEEGEEREREEVVENSVTISRTEYDALVREIERLRNSVPAEEQITNPQIVRKIETANSIEKAKEISQTVSYWCGWINIGTAILKPLCRRFELDGLAEASEFVNTCSKGTQGACKITSGVCNAIETQDGMYLLESASGACDILGAACQYKENSNQKLASEQKLIQGVMKNKREGIEEKREEFTSMLNESDPSANMIKNKINELTQSVSHYDSHIEEYIKSIEELEKKRGNFSAGTKAFSVLSNVSRNTLSELKVKREMEHEITAKEVGEALVKVSLGTVRDEFIERLPDIVISIATDPKGTVEKIKNIIPKADIKKE